MKQWKILFVSGATWDVESDHRFDDPCIGGWVAVTKLEAMPYAMGAAHNFDDSKLRPVGRFHINLNNVEAIKEA